MINKWTLLAWAMSSVLAAAPARGLTVSIPTGTITLKLTSAGTINTGTDGTPQDLAVVPGDNRLFIATRSGDIRIVANGAVGSTAFLNMTAAGVPLYTGGEGGFLGLAFSPNYTVDHTFYTLQTEIFSTGGPAADFGTPEQFPTKPANLPNNYITLRQWTTSANPNLANTTSSVLLRLNHPDSNHQGGSLRFGPDGDIYIGLGDGGGGNDFSSTATNPNDGHDNLVGNGQDLTVPFGKILRINPDVTPRAGFTVSTNGKYSIPNDNPFISGASGAVREIYAYGMRNPYKINFDMNTGILYVADVGQGQREEIDTVINGGNYGWPFREGTFNNTTGSGRAQPGGFTSLAPIAEYTHGDGVATIGGVLYRGSNPLLSGKFVFGDLGSGSIGRLFYTDPLDGNIFEFKYDVSGLTPSANLYSIDAGPNGELYGLFSNGQILNLTAVPEPASALLLLPGAWLLARRSRR